jgi:hypothetical protein
VRQRRRWTDIPRASAELKEIRMWPKRVEAGEDLAGCGMSRQMGCRVDHITDQIKPARFQISFAQEQSAGMDARMHSQRQKSWRQTVVAQSADSIVDIEGGLRGTPAIVLARLWVAKDREGTVTLRSNHAAAVSDYYLMPDPAQLAQEFGEVLRLHFPTQCSRSHQIGEEDRQAMTFAARGDSRFSGRCAHRRLGRLLLDG